MWPVVTMRLNLSLSSLPRRHGISDHFTPNWMRQPSPEIYLAFHDFLIFPNSTLRNAAPCLYTPARGVVL